MLQYLRNFTCLDNGTVLKAEYLVKGFHNVQSCKSTWYFFQGVSLTPVAVASLLIHPKMSQCFHIALFKFTLVYIQKV